MRRSQALCAGVAALALGCVPGFAQSAEDMVLVRGARLFGQPLNSEHGVYRLTDTYVIWLVVNRNGELFEVAVGPKSYYTTEFPGVKAPQVPESLSEAEYSQTLRKISKLREIGKLQQRHGPPVPSSIGPLNTDRFEKAFVERLTSGDDGNVVRKFTVYFLQDMSGSPEQLMATQAQSMLCLGGVWYYMPPEQAKRVRLGKWQTLQIAGPTLLGKAGCFRTTPVRDADGFTIEEPQTEWIVISEPYTVRALAGRVHLSESPIEAANVEFLRIGTKKVLRTKTDYSGAFQVPRVRNGKYKFKVTKNGFKAVSGIVIVDGHAPADQKLSFELPVAT